MLGPARGWLWIAAVYRPFGHVAGTPQVLWGVACRTGHDDLVMTDDRQVGGTEAVPGLSEGPGGAISAYASFWCTA